MLAFATPYVIRDSTQSSYDSFANPISLLGTRQDVQRSNLSAYFPTIQLRGGFDPASSATFKLTSTRLR